MIFKEIRSGIFRDALIKERVFEVLRARGSPFSLRRLQAELVQNGTTKKRICFLYYT